MRIENGEMRIENGEMRIENGEMRNENGEWRINLSFLPQITKKCAYYFEGTDLATLAHLEIEQSEDQVQKTATPCAL